MNDLKTEKTYELTHSELKEINGLLDQAITGYLHAAALMAAPHYSTDSEFDQLCEAACGFLLFHSHRWLEAAISKMPGRDYSLPF